jgi:hypothetical protein
MFQENGVSSKRITFCSISGSNIHGPFFVCFFILNTVMDTVHLDMSDNFLLSQNS